MKMDQAAIPSRDGRDARLQWVRSIGAILVVCLHSASEHMYSLAYGSAEWWFVNIINGLSRCSVPLFVMASGAVFLDRDILDFKEFYSKRLRRIAVPIIVWTVVYIVVGILENHVSLTNIKYFKNLLESLYNGKPYYHLWYLYMLIGLYLVVPFISRLWASLNEKQRLLFMVVCFALAAIAPFESAFLPVESGSPFFLLYRFLPYVGYFVCGHYMKTIVDKQHNRLSIQRVILLMAALALVTVVGSYFTGSNKVPGLYFFHYLSVNVILFTVLLYFIFMKWVQANKNPPRFIQLVDKTSLAIYLIHPIILILIGYLYQAWMPKGVLFSLYILGKIAITLSASLLIGWVMLKVPGLRKTVS